MGGLNGDSSPKPPRLDRPSRRISGAFYSTCRPVHPLRWAAMSVRYFVPGYTLVLVIVGSVCLKGTAKPGFRDDTFRHAPYISSNVRPGASSTIHPFCPSYPMASDSAMAAPILPPLFLSEIKEVFGSFLLGTVLSAVCVPLCVPSYRYMRD